jgi:hypothetical protein
VRLSIRVSLPWIAAGALMLAACYEQPALAPQRPLRCTITSSKMSDECPKGYACQGGVCAPTSCQHNSNCPPGLMCTNSGCVLPPDGGQFDAEIQIPASRDAVVLEAGLGDAAPGASDAEADAPVADAPVIDGGQD